MNHYSFLKQPFLLQFCISIVDKSCADERDFLKEVVSQYLKKRAKQLESVLRYRGNAIPLRASCLS